MPAAALADVRATPGVRSAVALTPTTLGPSLGASGGTIPLPLSHALNGGLPYVPARPLAAIVGITALVALLALALPTRHALRARPIEAIGIRE